MAKPEITITTDLLRRLQPLSELSHDRLQELADKSRLIELAADRELFREGDRDNRTLYLLNGELKLSNRTGAAMLLKSNNRAAAQPIDNQNPRVITARARTPSKLLSIDSDLLEMLLNWDDEQAVYEVEEVDFSEDADWISNLLYTQGLLNLPPQSIQALVTRLQEVRLSDGEVVLKEGEEDDFYYIIKQGRCQVSRIMPGESKPTVLCELAAGEGFGEEALITHGRRNATVTMVGDGTLLKLDKSDFNSLIASFLVSQVDGKEAQGLVATGTTVLDVRTPEEYHRNGVGKSMPLALLRREMSHFDPDRKYIVCCDDGRRSAAAAFLMRRMGLNVHALQGGLAMHRGEIEQALTAQGAVKSLGDGVVYKGVAASPGEGGEESRQQLTELQQQNMRLQSEVRKTVEQAQLVKAQLEKALSEQLRQTSEAQSAHQQVASEMALLRQRMEQLQSGAAREGEVLNGELSSVRGELEAALSRAAGAEQGQSSLEREIDRLREEMASQQQEAEERHQQQSAQLRQADNMLAKLQSEHAQALQAREAEVEASQRRLAEAEAERDEHTATLEALRGDQAKSEAELQKVVDEAQRAAEESAQQLAEREAELDALRSNQDASLTQLEDGVEEARRRARDAEQALAREQQAAEALKQRHERETESLQAELALSRRQSEEGAEAVARQVEALETLKAEQQGEVERLEAELAQMHASAAEANGRLAAMEQERHTLEEAIAVQQQQVETERRAFEQELASARDEIVALKGRIADLGNENQLIRNELEAEIGQLNAALDQAHRELEQREARLIEAQQREQALRVELEAQQQALDDIRERHKHEVEQALLNIQQLHTEKRQLNDTLETAQAEVAELRGQVAEGSESSASQMAELRVLFEQYKRENAKLKAEIVAKSLAESGTILGSESRIERAQRRRYATQAASSAWMMLSSENKEGGKQEINWDELPTFEMGAEYGDGQEVTPVQTGWTKIRTE